MKTTDKDILKDNARLKEMPFGLPDGYFESMKKALKETKQQAPDHATGLRWSRISIAAAVAILIVAGSILFCLPDAKNGFTEEDYLVFSDDISTEVIYSTSTLYAYSENLTDEDIIEYLIDSGWEIDDME